MKTFMIKLTLGLFALYYLLPIAGTVLYASSTTWSKTMIYPRQNQIQQGYPKIKNTQPQEYQRLIL